MVWLWTAILRNDFCEVKANKCEKGYKVVTSLTRRMCAFLIGFWALRFTNRGSMTFAIKAEVSNPRAATIRVQRAEDDVWR